MKFPRIIYFLNKSTQIFTFFLRTTTIATDCERQGELRAQSDGNNASFVVITIKELTSAVEKDY